jgi:hypothetical protein
MNGYFHKSAMCHENVSKCFESGLVDSMVGFRVGILMSGC